MRGKSSGGARQRTQQRDGDAASDRATQRDVYVSDVLERPELANKEQREWAAVEAYVAAANVAKMWA